MDLAKRNLLVEKPAGEAYHTKSGKTLPKKFFVFCVPPGLTAQNLTPLADSIKAFCKRYKYDIQHMSVKYLPDDPSRPHIITVDSFDLN